MVNSIVDRVRSLQASVDRVRGKLEEKQRSLFKYQNSIHKMEDDKSDLEVVATLFRQLIDQEILDGVSIVENLLTEGLQSVFPDRDLSVRADVEVKRGKVSVLLKTIEQNSDGTVIEGLSKDSFGDSVSTIQSIILRILLSLKHDLRPVLFLDEALPALDELRVLNMAHFLKKLCSDLGLDVLMVTHNPLLFEVADRVYEMQKIRGVSKTKLVKSDEN